MVFVISIAIKLTRRVIDLIHADKIAEIDFFRGALANAKIATLSNEYALRVFAGTIVIAVVEKALASDERKEEEEHNGNI